GIGRVLVARAATVRTSPAPSSSTTATPARTRRPSSRERRAQRSGGVEKYSSIASRQAPEHGSTARSPGPDSRTPCLGAGSGAVRGQPEISVAELMLEIQALREALGHPGLLQKRADALLVSPDCS